MVHYNFKYSLVGPLLLLLLALFEGLGDLFGVKDTPLEAVYF